MPDRHNKVEKKTRLSRPTILTLIHLLLDAGERLLILRDHLAASVLEDSLHTVQVLVQLDQLVVHRVEAQANRLMCHEEQLRHKSIAGFSRQRLDSCFGYQ